MYYKDYIIHDQEELKKSLEFFIGINSMIYEGLCIEIFGNSTGKHLWNKYLEYNKDITIWFNSLVGGNKGLVIQWYNKWLKETRALEE